MSRVIHPKLQRNLVRAISSLPVSWRKGLKPSEIDFRTNFTHSDYDVLRGVEETKRTFTQKEISDRFLEVEFARIGLICGDEFGKNLDRLTFSGWQLYGAFFYGNILSDCIFKGKSASKVTFFDTSARRAVFLEEAGYGSRLLDFSALRAQGRDTSLKRAQIEGDISRHLVLRHKAGENITLYGNALFGLHLYDESGQGYVNKCAQSSHPHKSTKNAGRGRKNITNRSVKNPFKASRFQISKLHEDLRTLPPINRTMDRFKNHLQEKQAQIFHTFTQNGLELLHPSFYVLYYFDRITETCREYAPVTTLNQYDAIAANLRDELKHQIVKNDRVTKQF